MTQEEFNAWIAQQGGPQAVQFATENRTVPNPAKQDPAAKLDDAIPPTITVNVMTWVNPKTGAKLSLSPKGPGQYDIVEQVGAKPANADPGAAAADANAVELQKQRERNAALPPDQDPAYETDAERRARGRQTALDQQAAADKAAATAKAASAGTVVKASDGKTYILHQDGTTTPTNLPPDAKPGTHSTVKGGDGKTYVVTVNEDGSVTSTDTGVPPEPTKPISSGKDEGGDYTITTGPDGQPVKTYAKTTGAPAAGEPPGAPPPDYSTGNVAKNLTDYSTWLNQQVMDGTVDQPTATRLMASRRALAETAVSEQANATRTATDVYGHQVSERNTDVNASTTRNSTAVGGVNTAFQLVQGGAAAQPKGSDAAYRAFQGLLQTQLQQSQAMGGMNQPPPVPIPAAAQPYMTITSPGGTKVDLHDTAGGTPPTPGVGGTPAIPARPDVQGPTSGPMPGSVSAESAAAPAGQIPAALAAHADSKPTGNAFADTEMTLTAAGISPAAIAAARERFLAAQTQSAPDAVNTFSQGFQMPALAGA